VTEKEKAKIIVRETQEYIDAIKVGYPLVLSTGLDVTTDLKKFGKPIIADFKVADVPHVSSEVCRMAKEAGADYVIVQGFLGEDVIKACSEVTRIFVVSDMSHPGSLDFISTHKTIKTLRNIVENLTIISPGVKAQGAKVGSAITAGADFEIIGRAIYNSPQPRLEASKIYHQLTKGEIDE
jgi:orotidine-5'-phosphate decarboxylase